MTSERLSQPGVLVPVMVTVVVIAGGVTVVAKKLAQWDSRMPWSPRAALPVTAAAQESLQTPRSRRGLAIALPTRASATTDLENIMYLIRV